MQLAGKTLADLIERTQSDGVSGISITPYPDLDEIRSRGHASVDLLLGRWFLSLRQLRTAELTIPDRSEQLGVEHEAILARRYFVPFTGDFVLHPGRFVLSATLEWIKLPANVSGLLTGKSSLGRRGLIIEMALGVHPGFVGCLTLELANVGEVPIRVSPGTRICQLFLHEAIPGRRCRLRFLELAQEASPRTRQAGRFVE